MEPKVIWGQELPKEAWESAAERIMQVACAVADSFEKANYNGRGKEDAEDFITDIMLAQAAMKYVAENARDKCRVIPVP